MWSGWRLRRAAEVVFLAIVAYVPMLLSSPGRVSADSKQALFVDPSQFLSRAVNMWDPSFGAGTVPHQHIGYVWPMGPWFWFFDQIGVPVWIAQRLWLGTLVLAAALGARWLARSLGASSFTATALALVYALTPYQLAFTARASVLLLPWVGLPWLVELTRRSVRHQGWRHPALFGLVVATVAGVNATSLLLVGLGPLLVLVAALFDEERSLKSAPIRRVAATTARLGVVSLAVSAWWLVGLRVQGSHGLPVLHLTENLTDIARWSLPGDVLRGLGNWFFAGRDRLGYSVDQAGFYLDNPAGIALTLVLPVAALVVALLTRGSLRLFAVVTVVVAMVIGVGAWPTHQPTIFGRAFTWFVDETSAGLALRNSHRIVPLLVLGVMLLLAVGIEQLVWPRLRLMAAAGIAAVALLALGPVLARGFLSEHLDRPEDLPAAWLEAAEVLDSRGRDPDGNPYRVLEVPGSPFAAHRWGNTVEAILPSLVDRPHLAREVLPYGSEATTNLLDAFDRRMQEGVFEPATIAPIARLFAATDVVVRSDLAFERFRSPDPAGLWMSLMDDTPGVAEVQTFGPRSVNAPDPRLGPVAEPHLHFESLMGTEPPKVGGEVPPVGILSVTDAPPVLQVLAPEQAVVLAGDGDGIVDSAAAGLIDGHGPIIYVDSIDDAQLAQVAEQGANLILTDSNRRRIQTWFYAIRDTRGPTERAGETLVEPTGYDRRIYPFDIVDDSSQSVVEHMGATVTATATGGAARPEDRAVAAVDGDIATSWRVGGPDPRGHRLSLTLDQPLTLDRIAITQPLDGPRDRQLESVRIHTNGHPPMDVALGPASMTPDGQVLTFEARTIDRVEVEITGVSAPPFDPALANAVGIAELRLGDLVVDETVVMPGSMLERLGSNSASLGLDVVMTRLRYDPYDRGRIDTERRLDRTFALPTTRAFQLSGLARVSPSATDSVLDELLGTGGQLSVAASSRLTGDLSARARSAVDGRSDTAWTAAFGEQVGQWIEVDHGEAASPQAVSVTMVVDDLHSAPTALRVEVDGEVVAHREVALPPNGPPGATHTESIDLPPGGGGRVRIVVDGVRRLSAPPGEPAMMATLPVAVSEIEFDHEPNPQMPAPIELDTGCRADLMLIDGEALPVRVRGQIEAIRDGLSVELCGEDALRLEPGPTRIESMAGYGTGIDIDRLVLSSGPDGGARPPGPRGGVDSVAARLTSVASDPTSWSATVETDGTPFWLILAQSDNAGWRAEVDHASVGERTLIDGYANGWWVEPDAAGTLAIDLNWTPQKLVWWGLAISAFSVALLAGFVLGSGPRAFTPPPDQPHPHQPQAGESGGNSGLAEAFPWRPVLVSAAAVGFFVAVIAPPWMGVVAFGAAVARAVIPRSALLLAIAVPALIAASLLLDQPNLPWLAVAIVVAGVAGAEAASGWTGLRTPWSVGNEAPGRAREFRTPRPIYPENVGPQEPETGT